MASNSAAYLVAPYKPLEVSSAAYTPPSANEIVVKNAALAINPVDWLKATKMNDLVFKWIKLPFVLGSYIAGEVVQVGSDITRFKPGDRVLSHACGTNEEYNTSSKSAFQE